MLTHVKIFNVYMFMGSKSRVSAELLARYQRSSVSGLWRQLMIGQSNDITLHWGFPRIKVISTKTSVVREDKSTSLSDVWLHTSARLDYRTSSSWICYSTFKPASAFEHKPWHRITCSSYFKPLPQTEQLPHLNQPCEWSEFFLFAEEQL